MNPHKSRLIKTALMSSHNISFNLAYVVNSHESHLIETILMSGHNISFNLEILKVIPKLFLLPYFFGYKTEFFPSKTIPKI